MITSFVNIGDIIYWKLIPILNSSVPSSPTLTLNPEPQHKQVITSIMGKIVAAVGLSHAPGKHNPPCIH